MNYGKDRTSSNILGIDHFLYCRDHNNVNDRDT